MNEVCPLELERAFNAWITEGLGLNLEDEAAGSIIDGKVLRGTRSDHARTMQILTALDHHTGCVLSETAIASDTNEAKAAVEFLKTVVLEGKTVVGDTGFCLRDICETILSKHGEYLILVKDKQPTLHKEAIPAFVIPEGPVLELNRGPYAKRTAYEASCTASTIEKSRGRVERHTLTATSMGPTPVTGRDCVSS